MYTQFKVTIIPRKPGMKNTTITSEKLADDKAQDTDGILLQKIVDKAKDEHKKKNRTNTFHKKDGIQINALISGTETWKIVPIEKWRD